MATVPYGRREQQFDALFLAQKDEKHSRMGVAEIDRARRSGRTGGVRRLHRELRHVTDRVHAQKAAVRRMAEMAQLHSLLPICSYCRRVRNDSGYWQRVEEYVSDHTMTEFSHGICPTCLETEMQNVAGLNSNPA